MKKIKYKSYIDILSYRFIKGMTKIFNLFGNLNKCNNSYNYIKSDAKAIYSDWLSIGNDLSNLIEERKC